MTSPDHDPVDPAAVAERLVPPLAGPVTWLAEVGSTNDLVAAAARQGAGEGTVVGADHQVAGRGRRGRGWEETPGHGLLFSVLLRPPLPAAGAALLPIVVAVGVAEGISRAAGVDARIAWPNDVLVDGRKVGGILCELSARADHVDWAVAGIGLNVHSAPRVESVRWTPGAIAPAATGPLRRAELLVAVLGALGARLESWYDGDTTGVLQAFAMRDHLAGHRVRLHTEAGDHTGEAAGLDAGGRLLLRTRDGLVALGAGEVTGVDASPG